MTRPLEKVVERNVCNVLYKRHGVVSLKLNVSGQTGFPDRMFLPPGGRPVFVEFKRPGEVLRARQRYVCEQLVKLGYVVMVHDNEETAIKEILKAVGPSRVSEKGDNLPD